MKRLLLYFLVICALIFQLCDFGKKTNAFTRKNDHALVAVKEAPAAKEKPAKEAPAAEGRQPGERNEATSAPKEVKKEATSPTELATEAEAVKKEEVATESAPEVESAKPEEAAGADTVENCSIGVWESPKDDDEATLAFECPSVYPITPTSAWGCCGRQKSGFLKYNNLSCMKDKQHHGERLIRGASLLKGKQLVFVGDSVGQQWLNSMLLAAYSKDSSLLPRNQSIWTESNSRSFGEGKSPYQYEPELGYCRFPMYIFNMSSAWPDAPVIASFKYPNEWCPPSWKKGLYRQCCPGGNPISRTGHILSQLEEMKADIVIAQMGVHWHTVPKFKADFSEMLTLLANYSSAATNSNSVSAPLVLFLESLPQHFDAPSGDGSYDDFRQEMSKRKGVCFPINRSLIEANLLLPHIQNTSTACYNYNRIAKKAIDQTPGVQWVSSNSKAYASRNDGHRGATKCCARHRDCTHYCYSPHLYQPAVEPFLLAVDRWY